MATDQISTVAKLALLTVQAAGLVLSIFLIVATYAKTPQVERQLRSFAIAQVDHAAQEAWQGAKDRMGANGRAERLAALKERFGREADETEEERKRIVPALLARAMSERCGEDCGFWALTARTVNSAMVQRIASLRVGQRTLSEFVVERYERTMSGLMVDLRRFGIVNAVALSLMIGLILFRGLLNWRFTAFSVILTSYVAYAAYGYLFEQNWAMAMLTQDWAAIGYQTMMIFVSCLLFDWLFLNGRITDAVISALASALPG
jgi:hypothetical protein